MAAQERFFNAATERITKSSTESLDDIFKMIIEQQTTFENNAAEEEFAQNA